MKQFPPDFYDYLKHHELIKIRTGKEHENFISIWMVTVGDRIFARSSGSRKSWYETLLEEGFGQIEYKKHILDIYGKKPEENLVETVNDAYKQRYSQFYNLHPLKLVLLPECAARTVEFFLKD